MADRTILVVEDDAAIRMGVRDALASEGYRVLEAADGDTGLRMGLTEDPDLIVLDLMLPGLDGFEVLRCLRADCVETPVLVLTARGLEQDRVKGLDLGADDYIVKPFGLAELLARVRSRLRSWDRERGLDRGAVLRFGGVTVDFDARSAVKDGEPLHLTPKELDLLAYLASRQGRAVSRAELLGAVWGEEEVVSRVVDTAILGLRKKVEAEPAEPRHILSVRGVGYRFARRP
ncbi:MAG: response regulator transcription factor [Planctomycetota bacterium]|jgi:DNA-binding response OmpR family regulator